MTMGALRSSLTRVALGTSVICAAIWPAWEGSAYAQTPSSAARQPDAAKMEEARRHFERGLVLLRDPEGEKVESAFLEFKAAYELSHSPRVLGNIGYCAMRMERNTESVDAYREYMRLVPDIDPAERQQIKQDLVTMTEGAASVSVRYTGRGAWSLIDERTPVQGAVITNVYEGRDGEPLALLVHPGRHTMRVKVNGEEQARWELEAVGGASLTHAFEPKPVVATPPQPIATTHPHESKPVSHVPQYVLMGAGGVLLVASGITGLVAYNKMKSIERECPNNVCPNGSFHSDVDSARTLGTTTDVLLISGAVLAASGAVWLALTPSRRDEGTAVSGACVPGSCGFAVRGSF